MRPYRLIGLMLILILVGFQATLNRAEAQPPRPAAAADLPPGLSATDWQAIRAQLPQYYLKAPNADAEDRFGTAIAISGDTVVIGAPNESSDGSSPEDNSALNAGAVYVFVRTTDAAQTAAGAAVWTLQAYLKAPNPDITQAFGLTVAIEGDTIVLGAPFTINNNANGSGGSVYVFVRSNAAAQRAPEAAVWTLQAHLKAANEEATDGFGYSVAIAGDTVVVGTPSEDSDGSSPADNSAEEAGAAYVFVRTSDAAHRAPGAAVWTQQAYLKAANADAGDLFGETVVISGDIAVVGAPREDSNGSGPDDNSKSNAGAVYVFVRTSVQGLPTWSQEAYLKGNPPNHSDFFGAVLAIDGNTLVVGYPGEDGRVGPYLINSGAAYVFVRTSTPEAPIWTEQGYLKAANAELNDSFGTSVAIDGDTVVIGAGTEDSDGSGPADNSIEDAGAAYVFVRTTDETPTWSQHAYLKAANADISAIFGSAAAIEGNTVVVGAQMEYSDGSDPTNHNAPRSGAAYVIDIRPFNTYLPLAMRP